MSKKYLLPLLLPFCLIVVGCNSPNKVATGQVSNGAIEEPIIAEQATFSYQDYADILRAYVDDNGLVDYQGLQANRLKLDSFNKSLGNVSPSVYQSWSEPQKLAFLINSYNAFTLQSVIDQKPLKDSIRKIPGVWKRRKFLVAGEEKTLDNIEHSTIRQEFNEPRIHAALVCAAVSCPILRNEPYTGDRLEQQLEDQSQKWILGKHGLVIDRASNTVFISAIFKWFGEDWLDGYKTNKFAGNRKQKASLNFISQYIDPEDATYLEQGNYKVKTLNYDWSLNRQ